jgi:dihydrodipicolinate synthase/N-acetylneuraminate lyase
LAKLGLIGPEMRPPMVAPDAEEMKRIDQLLVELKALAPMGVA